MAARTLPPLSGLATQISDALEPGVREGMRRDLLEELRRFVEPVVQGVTETSAVEEGNVVGTIVEKARDADLIVSVRMDTALERAAEEARRRMSAALAPDEIQWQDGEPLVATGRSHTEILRRRRRAVPT